MSVLDRTSFATCLAAAALALSGGVTHASAQTANSLQLRVFQSAIQNARTAYPRLAGTPPRVVPGNAQYRDGLQKLQDGQYLEAATALAAAVRADTNSALYRGDLAAANIALQDANAASLQLVMARQKQPGNQWYTVALSAVMAMRQQYREASVNLDVAVSGDSSIIDSTIAEAGVAWAFRGGRIPPAQAWGELATRRFPSVGEPWLRLAMIYRNQGDTTRGVQAARTYVGMRPTDRAGQFIYSLFLFDLGRGDSAATLAAELVQDSTNREQATAMLIRIGQQAFTAAQDTSAAAQATQAERRDLAIRALSVAQPYAPARVAPGVAAYLGLAQAQKFATQLRGVESRPDCGAAQQLDSLAGRAIENLRLGLALDSAAIAPHLSASTELQTRVHNLVNRACTTRR